MLRLTEAAAAAGVEASLILRGVGEGRVHFLDSDGGILLICLASLQT
jgi:hypothetical protein